MLDQIVSHYRIVEKLGGGTTEEDGMEATQLAILPSAFLYSKIQPQQLH